MANLLLLYVLFDILLKSLLTPFNANQLMINVVGCRSTKFHLVWLRLLFRGMPPCLFLLLNLHRLF